MSRPRMPKAHRDARPLPADYVPFPGPPARHHRRKLPEDPPLVYLADGQTLSQRRNLRRLPGQVGFAGDRVQERTSEEPPNSHGDEYLFHDQLRDDQHHDHQPLYLPTSPSATSPSASRHQRKREAQWKRWSNDVIPHLIGPYMDLLQTTASLRTRPLTPQLKTCVCGKPTKKLQVTIVKFNELLLEEIHICDCNPAAHQLLAIGSFPCAPYRPTLAVDIKMLDFATRLFVRISPNNTAWCGTVEELLDTQGYKLTSSGSLRRRFGVALQWYNSLQSATNAHIDDAIGLVRQHITRLEDGLAQQADPMPEATQYWPGGSPNTSRRATVEEVDDEDALPARAASASSLLGSHLESEVPPRNARKRRQPASSDDPPPDGPFATPLPRVRPSDYLRQRCPLCFGGNRRLDLGGPDSIVCIDACFTQKHNDQIRDPPRIHPKSVFVPEGDADIMEKHVASVRPPRPQPKKKAKLSKEPQLDEAIEDGYEGPLLVPTSVLDGCEDSFLAADERREKASTQFFASTALMAILCRHDRVLWLVDMKSAGEKQHYALVLLETLFQHLPLTYTIGLLYDIGCQLHRTCIKWDFLKPYLHRLIFAISVFHAFGHQWPCQIIYHPRKCKGFGFSDGEGCERFWHSISKLIAYLRVCGHYQRIYTIDLQVQHADLENLEKLGRWLFRRTQHCLNKRSEAEQALHACGMPIELLRSEWASQVAAQTKPLPRRSRNIAKTAVDDILRVRKSRDILSAREENLLKIINDPNSADYLVLDSENKYHATVSALARLTDELSQRERALGVEDKQQLRNLSNNPYLRDRMNALALKTRLRDKLRSRKFELDRLERTFRKQVNERKVHHHIEASVKRRDPSIKQLARSYNELCDKIAVHIRRRSAPPGSVCPQKIDPKGLFALDVDDDIWQDIGLTDAAAGAGDPPLWLADNDVRSGILAMLELDRCVEEEARLHHERRAMQEWFAEEWSILNLGIEVTRDPGMRYQIELRRKSLCRLCVIWRKSAENLPCSRSEYVLQPWGPTSDELFDQSIAAVTASWGDNSDPTTNSDSELDDDNDDFDIQEDDLDIGLISALDAVDLSDVYRHEIEDSDMYI